MKRQINLIPDDMAVAGKTVTLAKTLNKISTIGTILLIFVVVILISGLVYFNLENNKINTRITSLRKEIVDLEKNEQKLILAKDKLSKITYVKSLDSVDDELKKFIEVQSLVSTSSGSNLAEINIDPKKTETSFSFPDTVSLGMALEAFSKLNKYQKIVMSSLGYNASSGYLVNLILSD